MRIRLVLVLFLLPVLNHSILLLSLGQTTPIIGTPPASGVSSYNPAVPTPEEVLGYVIGEKHTYPHLIVDYFKEVARASDRVIVETHGKSYDGRPLMHAVITSASNHTRLEEIRQANLMLSGNPTAVGDEYFRNAPTIVWMGYGIHGNEASSFEAALLVLYHLSAGEGPAIDELLGNVVVILIPSQNPDGHMRHVHWVNSNRGRIPTADPQHREQSEPWPGGRTNYYWFDLNRDWFPVQHPESKGRLALYNRWRPQLLTDFHEMGSDATYFFQPGSPTGYNPNIPAGTRSLLDRIGKFHAAALDERGILYFTGEVFDDFYIGKGSTYPMVTGAVGILFEQASTRALKRETPHGIRAFHESILNQYTTSLSTLEACVRLRTELLRNQHEFYRTASQAAADSEVRAYIVSTEYDGSRAAAFIDILLRHRIKVYQLRQEVSISGRRYIPGKAIVIPVDQLEARLIRAAMERYTDFEDSVFYDISTWTLPLAFNQDYAEYNRNPIQLLGEEIMDTETPTAALHGDKASFAYVIPWQNYYASRSLYRLQEKGIHTYVSTRPFAIMHEGIRVSMERGSIIIPVVQQGVHPETIYQTITTVPYEDGVDVYALDTGRTMEGPDLGSPSVRYLEKPEIALFVGQGISAGEAGEVWHLLNEKMGIPVTLLDIHRVSVLDLSRYNTFIMVNGMYEELPDTSLKIIGERISSGAILICTKNASRYIVENGVIEGTVTRLDIDTLDVSFEDIQRARSIHRIGGVILTIEVDHTHPIAYGYGTKAYVFRNHENVFERSGTPGVNIATYTEKPLISGYISERRENELKRSVALMTHRKGNGRVILFADNPNFRSFWYGTNGFFLNSVFFGRIF
jgi:hypothetical protein